MAFRSSLGRPAGTLSRTSTSSGQVYTSVASRKKAGEIREITGVEPTPETIDTTTIPTIQQQAEADRRTRIQAEQQKQTLGLSGRDLLRSQTRITFLSTPQERWAGRSTGFGDTGPQPIPMSPQFRKRYEEARQKPVTEQPRTIVGGYKQGSRIHPIYDDGKIGRFYGAGFFQELKRKVPTKKESDNITEKLQQSRQQDLTNQYSPYKTFYELRNVETKSFGEKRREVIKEKVKAARSKSPYQLVQEQKQKPFGELRLGSLSRQEEKTRPLSYISPTEEEIYKDFRQLGWKAGIKTNSKIIEKGIPIILRFVHGYAKGALISLPFTGAISSTGGLLSAGKVTGPIFNKAITQTILKGTNVAATAGLAGIGGYETYSLIKQGRYEEAAETAGFYAPMVKALATMGSEKVYRGVSNRFRGPVELSSTQLKKPPLIDITRGKPPSKPLGIYQSRLEKGWAWTTKSGRPIIRYQRFGFDLVQPFGVSGEYIPKPKAIGYQPKLEYRPKLEYKPEVKPSNIKTAEELRMISLARIKEQTRIQRINDNLRAKEKEMFLEKPSGRQQLLLLQKQILKTKTITKPKTKTKTQSLLKSESKALQEFELKVGRKQRLSQLVGPMSKSKQLLSGKSKTSSLQKASLLLSGKQTTKSLAIAKLDSKQLSKQISEELSITKTSPILKTDLGIEQISITSQIIQPKTITEQIRITENIIPRIPTPVIPPIRWPITGEFKQPRGSKGRGRSPAGRYTADLLGQIITGLTGKGRGKIPKSFTTTGLTPRLPRIIGGTKKKRKRKK